MISDNEKDIEKQIRQLEKFSEQQHREAMEGVKPEQNLFRSTPNLQPAGELELGDEPVRMGGFEFQREPESPAQSKNEMQQILRTLEDIRDTING